MRAAAHADPERLGEAAQRALRKPQRLQPFIGEADIDGKSRPVLFPPGIDALEQDAQPCARFRAVVELDEDVAPVAHQDGRDDVVLNVVQIVFQVSRGQDFVQS